MANAERPNVNQRLYFASLHLRTMEQLLAEQQLPRQVIEQAFGASVLMHLVMAYRNYLRELAVAYLLPVEHYDGARQLEQTLAAQGKVSAECRELLALERESGWLSGMLSAFAGLGRPSPADGRWPASGGDGAPSAIRLRTIDDDFVSRDNLESVLRALQGLIENQRTRLEEW